MKKITEPIMPRHNCVRNRLCA